MEVVGIVASAGAVKCDTATMSNVSLVSDKLVSVKIIEMLLEIILRSWKAVDGRKHSVWFILADSPIPAGT